MNKLFKIILLSLMLAVSIVAISQPFPNGGNDPGPGNEQVGGGAPLDGGLSVLLIMAAVYALRGRYLMQRDLGRSHRILDEKTE